VELSSFVSYFATAMTRADGRGPAHITTKGRAYQPGIGPHPEDRAVRLTLDELRRMPEFAGTPFGQALPYPRAPRQRCDVWVGEPLEWAIEVKMARFRGDNGKPDDTSLKDLLSPYEKDRSALTDCRKLAAAGFDCSTAVLIYGFDYEDRSLDPAIEAFERLAEVTVELGPRIEAPLVALVHPVHSKGRVFAWQVRAP
jgi:hypothetical protein